TSAALISIPTPVCVCLRRLRLMYEHLAKMSFPSITTTLITPSY
ncbi:molybdopterin oxidoreductase family protein, partial [Vibrio parahaemolyticus V-223/04]